MVAPTNDNFADATDIQILTPGAVYDSGWIECSDATTEPGEQTAIGNDNYRSIWFTYTPAHGGTMSLSKSRSGSFYGGYYAYMSVWTGSALGSLSLVTYGRDSLDLNVTPGVTYRIRMATRNYTDYSLGLTLTGETTVTTRLPARPALTVIPEDNTLTVRWAVGYDTTWEIRLDGGAWEALGAVGERVYTGMTIGQTYTIEVRGTNSLGTGPTRTRTVLMPNMIVFDSFTRSNSTTVVGTGEVGPAAISALGSNGISANQLYPSVVSSNVAIVYWECGTSNVDIRIKRAAGSQESGGIFFGATSATDGWYAYFNSATTAFSGGYVARYRGTTTVRVLESSAGPAVNPGAVLRLVHHDGIVQMWADSTLLLAGELPEPVQGTRHGVRSTATSHRWDDLTIRESSEITLETDSTALVPQTRAALVFDPVQQEAFLYKGRDTKMQDEEGVG